ncbi:MAG: hypothetical protein R3C68_13690 [Myxococcota bacterium]
MMPPRHSPGRDLVVFEGSIDEYIKNIQNDPWVSADKKAAFLDGLSKDVDFAWFHYRVGANGAIREVVVVGSSF